MMSDDTAAVVAICVSLVGALFLETACWMVLARRGARHARAKAWVLVLGLSWVGLTLLVGLPETDLLWRIAIAGVQVLAYAYLHYRLHMSNTLARLGSYLAGGPPLKIVEPRLADPRRLRRERRLMMVGVVITITAPIISAILYSEMRVYALLWVAIVAVPVGIILWRRFAASARRS